MKEGFTFNSASLLKFPKTFFLKIIGGGGGTRKELIFLTNVSERLDYSHGRNEQPHSQKDDVKHSSHQNENQQLLVLHSHVCGGFSTLKNSGHQDMCLTRLFYSNSLWSRITVMNIKLICTNIQKNNFCLNLIKFLISVNLVFHLQTSSGPNKMW